MLRTLAIEVRWEDYRFLIKPDVAKSWAEDLDARSLAATTCCRTSIFD